MGKTRSTKGLRATVDREVGGGGEKDYKDLSRPHQTIECSPHSDKSRVPWHSKRQVIHLRHEDTKLNAHGLLAKHKGNGQDVAQTPTPVNS